MIKVKVYYKNIKGKGKYRYSNEPKKNYEFIEAHWREPTVRLWKKVNKNLSSKIGPYELEINIWKYLLLHCSVFDQYTNLNKFDQEGNLSEEALNIIKNYKPGFLITQLIKPLIKETSLTVGEVETIQRQCQMLWLSHGSRVHDLHPIVEDAIVSMVFKEKYGIPTHQSVDDMPQRTFMLYKLVSNLYSEMMEMNQTSERLRREAKSQAGRIPQGE